MWLGLVIASLSVLFLFAKGDNFPSLLTTNATLAIIIDREYLLEQYENVRDRIETYLVYAKREILKHGGVNVHYYSWTSINVKRDITAILSIASCSDTWRLFRAAEGENLLHMAISEADCPRLPSSNAITVPIINRGQEMPQLFLDLRYAKAFNWKSIVIIYDYTLDRDMINRVITSLQTETSISGSAVSVIQLPTNSTGVKLRQSIKHTLSSISTKTVGSNFLAIVSVDMVEVIMEYAKSAGLVDTRSQWLYVISDTSWQKDDVTHLKRLLREGDNVAFAYNSTVVDGICSDGLMCHSEELLASFSHALDKAVQEEFNIASQVSDEEWEAIRPSKMERRNFLLENVKRYLSEKSVCGNCTMWGFHSGETWGKEYQQNSSSGIAELLAVGNWRPTDGPAFKDELFPHIAHGFRGRTLPLVTFHNPPWQILKLNANRSVIEYSGLVFDIIKELARNLNFTYTVDVVGFEKMVKPFSKNDSYNPVELTNFGTTKIPEKISGMIKTKSVAMAACVFTITDQEKLYLNFTVPVSTQSYSFLVARPKELSRALLFMLPFTKDTWLCLSISIVLMGPVLFYIHRFSPVYEYKGISMKGGLSSIQNCIWYMYGALLQQGGMHLPYADSARLVVGSWWLVVLVVATTYCGNLVAFLTFPKIDIPITTIDELIAHKDSVTWSVPKGSFLENQLKVTREPRFMNLYQGMVKVDQKEEMIEEIANGKHVFIDWKMRLQFIMKKRYLHTDRCEFAVGFDDFFDEQLGIAVAQDTPYLATINEEIRKLHQVGLIQKWLNDYLPKKDKCWKVRHTAEVNNHTVNMDDMQGSFFVLFFGFLLSVILIVGEKLWHRHKLKSGKKVIQPFAT